MPRKAALGAAALLITLATLSSASGAPRESAGHARASAQAPSVSIWPSPVRSGRAATVTLGDPRAATANRLIACLTPPGDARSRCHTAARHRQAGSSSSSGGGGGVGVTLHLGRIGRWQVEFRAAGPLPVPPGGLDLKRQVEVAGGRIRLLATGDSEIQGIDDMLAAGLPQDRVTGEAHISTGLSKPRMFDWVARAGVQVATLHPDVTVVYIGANDGFALPTPSGREVNCCGPDWVRAFAKRAEQMMAAYTRGGAGRVYWFNLPAPREPSAMATFAAIDRAYALAADRFPGRVRLLDIRQVFTPGGVYRDSMFYAGREQTVREPDGYHLSLAGDRIATNILIAAMRADGLLGA